MGLDQPAGEPKRHIGRFHTRRGRGDGYVAYNTAQVASGGGTLNIHIANETTGIAVEVHRFIVSSQFRGAYAVYDEFSSAPSGGTTDGIDNLLLDSDGGSPDTGSMTINYGVTFTESNTHILETLPSGGGGGSGIGTTGGSSRGTEPVIEPGREVVIQLINDSTNERRGTVGLVYTEDKGYV